MVLSPSGLLETETDVKTYKVVFISEQGGVLKIQEVVENYPAVAPVAPNKQGYTFKAWSEDYSSITKNTTIYPLYEKLPYTEGITAYYDESLRYELITNPFAFSSRYAGYSEAPLDKVVAVTPYEEGLIAYKKYLKNNDVIKSSGNTTIKEKNLIKEISLTNPIVFVPLLILIFVMIAVYLIKRKTIKEY